MDDWGNSVFLKSLGFPALKVHHSTNHFDFRIPQRRILVIGPMGSGKTEFSARVWRDAQILLKKSPQIESFLRIHQADRRQVFFVRSALDIQRFPEYPSDALAYRSGYERLGANIAQIRNSFELESLIEAHPECGTWIIDEASFYEERLAYVIRQASDQRGLSFIFPTLVLNFRRDIFNQTARLLLEQSTDVFPLTAYCEHPDCVEDSFYTYRWYSVNDQECPAPFFDPFIIIGGDRMSTNPAEPNYCTRCDHHHYLPGKEYTYLVLIPLAEAIQNGEARALRQELLALHQNPQQSRLAQSLEAGNPLLRRCLDVPFLAERALVYLHQERGILSETQVSNFASDLQLSMNFIKQRILDNT